MSLEDSYWCDVRQAPDVDSVMRAVLNYVMRAKHNETVASRVSKYARVLESFYQDEALPEHVSERRPRLPHHSVQPDES